ncbi:MAG: TIGR00730 family Rossman fold protein [Muribaculaceae bacterium]|nr:TIGR00730 family Rossman fold protein [Muribaculaceae bacterium]
MKRVAVYCAASAQIPADILAAGVEVGRLLAKSGCEVICGGGRTGLMRSVADGALAEGGRVVGVLPQFMLDKGWNNPHLSEAIAVPGMHERKAYFLNNANAIIALPGGIGTYDELCEAMSCRQLNLYHGQIVIFNYQGFFDPLIAQIRKAIDMKFMLPSYIEIFDVADTPEATVAAALAPVRHGDFEQKIK